MSGFMFNNSNLKMELDSTILRRCKLVIEELQADLTKRTVEVKQRDETIESVLYQRNSLFSRNQQLQQVVYELKQANVVLRGELKKAQSNEILEKEISRLQKQLHQVSFSFQTLQSQNKELELQLIQESENKRDIDKEITQAIQGVSYKIKQLEDGIEAKQRQNERLEGIISSRKCQYCEAISEIKNLDHLRKRIDDNLRSNTKVLSNEGYVKTASSRKANSVMKELSERKGPGNIIANNAYGGHGSHGRNRVKENELNFNHYPVTISPFVLQEKSIFSIFSKQNLKEHPRMESKENARENPYSSKKNPSINQEAVNATLRQIEDKLKRMSEKLQQNDQSDISTLIY